MIPVWPNGARIAVHVSILLETWSEGQAPQYGPQTTTLKPGAIDYGRIAWARYGGTTGVWRLLRILNQLEVPATFAPSARILELFPDAIKAIRESGHSFAGHSYTQDTLLSYLNREEERAVIARCVKMFADLAGVRLKGWGSPVISFTPHTSELLAEQGFQWQMDLYDSDLPVKIRTSKGTIVGIPVCDFADNRVLRTSPLDLFDTYKESFDYLYANEPGALIGLAFHCHSGGRPIVASMLDKILKYFRQFPDVWFASHDALAQWAIDHDIDERVTYATRFPDLGRKAKQSF